MRHGRGVAMRVVVLAAIVVFSSTGCVAYRGGAVPVVDPASLRAPASQRKVAYELRVESNVLDNVTLRRSCERHLPWVLGLAGADAVPAGSLADPDMTLTVSLTATGDLGADLLSAFISGFTFTIVPGYSTSDFALQATVVDRSGKQKAYHFRDSYTLWISVLLLPFNTQPDRVADELVADMMRTLVRGLQQDGFLPPAATGSVASSF